MKIIFVIPNLGAGGAERVITILANTFVEQEIDVDVLLLHDDTIAYPVSKKVRIVYFDSDLLTCNKSLSCKILRNYFKTQKRQNQRVVIIPFLDTCLKRVLVSAIGLDIPIIASERNDPSQKGDGIIAKIKANIPYMMATYCVFQTPGARDYYCNKVREKSNVIVNPTLIPETLRWKGQNSRRIVAIGRLEPQKNHMLLINAFSLVNKVHPEFKLEIYGEGSLRNEIQKSIYELNLADNVCLCGYSKDIYDVLENCAFFILPSDYEGMSNALIEAFLIGVPVISTDHPSGGAKMLIEDGVNGVLVPIKDKYAMASAMLKIIEDKNFSGRLGKNAKKARKEFSVQEISRKWMNVIYRCLEEL